MNGKPNKAQNAFINALLQLMKEKAFDQISISELSENAQYDRRTFYRYFQSKSDILYLYCASLLHDSFFSVSAWKDTVSLSQSELPRTVVDVPSSV
ncbi:MAG: TetR/AcrR family transcriptional regulator [Lachnospiraceae bacterium]|nr:TetR/AcrR family transcriptional regulator [Lachnospiraceae bacterium]